MKKSLLFFVFLIAVNFTKAQTVKSIFEGDKLVWYGLDFTSAKMIGMSDVSPSLIKADLFRAWNYVILDQPEKYQLEQTFRKGSIYKDPSIVEKLNETVNTSELMSYNENEVSPEAVQAEIKKYKTGDKKDGIGLVFIVENFNKFTATASVYVTFFDIATKKVILSKKVVGKAGGGGNRNYWAGAIFRILEKIKLTEYDNWKKIAE